MLGKFERKFILGMLYSHLLYYIGKADRVRHESFARETFNKNKIKLTGKICYNLPVIINDKNNISILIGGKR